MGKGIRIDVFPVGQKGDKTSKEQHPFRPGGDPGLVSRFSIRLFRGSPPGFQNPYNREIGSNHPLLFGTNNDFTRLAILADGKVGIGTNTPTSTLDVNGTTIIRGGLTLTAVLELVLDFQCIDAAEALLPCESFR